MDETIIRADAAPNGEGEGEGERLLRWAESLRRTAAATRAEAERLGVDWEYYDLSIASSDAQTEQAERLEAQASALRGEH